MENLNEIVRDGFNEVSLVNGVEYWKECEPNSYTTADKIAENLKDAQEKFEKMDKEEFIEVTSLDEFQYMEGESDNYKIKSIESNGSDGRSDIFCIFEFTVKKTNETVLIRFCGQYNSWDSDYWDETPSIVEEKTKTVKYYSSIK